jgi:hypothetical protein
LFRKERSFLAVVLLLLLGSVAGPRPASGLAALAAQLKGQQLQHLSLNFSGRKQLTDAGLAALASQLKGQQLQHLSLDFGGCEQLTDAG